MRLPAPDTFALSIVILILWAQLPLYHPPTARVKAPVVSVASAALPAASYIEAPPAGLISTVSKPSGEPVILKCTRIIVSPPARAVKPSFCVTFVMLAPVADPPFCANVNAKSDTCKIPAAAP